MLNEGNQIHNFICSSGSGSTSQKVTVPPVPQHFPPQAAPPVVSVSCPRPYTLRHHDVAKSANPRTTKRSNRSAEKLRISKNYFVWKK